MTDKALHLQLINNAINSYSLQSVITKGFGLTVLVSLFLFSSMYRNSNAFPVIDITFTVIAIFFWHADANYYRKKILYSRLYRKAVKQDNTTFSMDTSAFEKDAPWLHIVWLPQTCFLYLAITIAAATMSLIH